MRSSFVGNHPDRTVKSVKRVKFQITEEFRQCIAVRQATSRHVVHCFRQQAARFQPINTPRSMYTYTHTHTSTFVESIMQVNEICEKCEARSLKATSSARLKALPTTLTAHTRAYALVRMRACVCR